MPKSLVENNQPTGTVGDKVCPQVGENESSRRRLVYFAAFTLILIVAFAKPLISLAFYAAGQDLHSHILLVPLVFVYLIYLRRHQLPRRYNSSFSWTIFPLLIGVAALVVALTWSTASLSLNDYLALIMLSFVCFFAAGGFLFLGRTWMMAEAFTFYFLIFMVSMLDRLSTALQTE